MKTQHLEVPWKYFQVSVVAVQTLSLSTLYDPMDCSTPGFSVIHYLPMFKFMSIELMMPSNYLILLTSISPRIRVFSNESALYNCLGFKNSSLPIMKNLAALPDSIFKTYHFLWGYSCWVSKPSRFNNCPSSLQNSLKYFV